MPGVTYLSRSRNRVIDEEVLHVNRRKATAAASVVPILVNKSREQPVPTMCEYIMLRWFCDECGAWYTSDEVKTKDCETFTSTGSCDKKDIVGKEESDAGGLCDDCTQEHNGDA
ncbi:uncharacterized protein F4822DRAFT_433909 [Hypoxylon trugodes]|uniref:uncharacterized protein n=1 Tax=Hypoxylon trugodes TaxID=326681 RepID=UPI0021941317|nr:uncharacterized protein F4822DRAFT_433909 [Hypoxylon trugodes]KAI1383959.1 hypothetical protein F4822DRAFT_433909 [Hypoxylon trugodes]